MHKKIAPGIFLYIFEIDYFCLLSGHLFVPRNLWIVPMVWTVPLASLYDKCSKKVEARSTKAIYGIEADGMKYTCNDVFMIRTPSLPVNIFSDFLRFEGRIEDFIQQNNLSDFMDQSILVSSRALYEAKGRETQSRKKDKAKERSLLKYFTRSATRATPYGLFAGVALGEFSKDIPTDKIVSAEEKMTIECTADNAWLFHLIYTLENDPTVYPQLQLRFNPNCYVSGDRLKNPHYSNHGFVAPEKTVIDRNHIRATPLITYIKQEAKSFIGYTALVAKLQDRYPGVPEEKIISTLNMLIENEILLTNLRAPSNCADGLEYVLRILGPIEGIQQQKAALGEINRLIHEINHTQTLDGIDVATLQRIYALQEGLLGQGTEKDLLVVNKGLVLKENQLPYTVKTTIETFVEGLACLQIEIPSKLEKFKQRFQEEYGSEVEVPLCDIIDQNKFNGLSYLDSEQTIHSEKDKKIKQIVDEKILYCLQTQGEEVTLSARDFSDLDPVNDETLSDSFDINFLVTKEKDHYILSLAPAGGSLSAGYMFNRFGQVLDGALFRRYKENNKKMPSDPEVVSVEIREGSTKGRLSNINNHGNEHAYYIALATNDEHDGERELSLDDFLIGLQNDQIYIKSKCLGKRCKIVHDCMINMKTLSEVTRFLLYASGGDETGVLSGAYRLFENAYVFMPRIVLEGVMVHPKRWNLAAHLFALDTLQSFTQSFEALRQKYKIDEIVYLAELDNRLMLDLNNAYSMEILYQEMKKNKILRLDELEQNILTDNLCRDTSGRSYVSEISCSMLRTTQRKAGIVLDDRLDYCLQEANRPLLLLQDGWVYVKLYRMDDRENEVLNAIFCNLDHIGAPNFFYLRYSDEAGRHLRVRFQYEDQAAAQTHLLDLQKMLLDFRERKLIHSVLFDIYFRENNRYGGSQLIAFAEQVFFADSRFVIDLLNEFDEDDADGLERAYLLGIVTILTAFFDRREDMLQQLDLARLLDENKKVFRRKKQGYIKEVEQLLSQDFSGLSDRINQLMQEREEALKKYRNQIEGTARLTSAKENIIASVIHMFCNRLSGDRSLEHRYLNIVREALSNIIERDKRLMKKEG